VNVMVALSPMAASIGQPEGALLVPSFKTGVLHDLSMACEEVCHQVRLFKTTINVHSD